MNCEEVRKTLSLFLYGEVSLEEEQALQDHLDGCAPCRQALEDEKALHEALDARALAPSDELLGACRRELRLRVGFEARQRRLATRLRAWFSPGAGWRAFLPRPATAAALIALGFFAARWTSRTPSHHPAQIPAERQIASIRFLEPDPRGGVRIAVEETRRRVITGRPEEEPIQRLLLAAARQAADPGLRLESVELLGSRADHQAVRSALLEAIQSDPNPGVRLKALEALKPFASDPEVRQTLARVLLEDENPGVRIQVIDLLVQQPPQQTLVGLLQELLNKEQNSYVRWRTQQALEALNASVGTF